MKLKKTELPPELKSNILSKPFYRQPAVIELFDGASESSIEQGRLGRGQFAGLKFARVGRTILYPAQAIIDFIESLPLYANTTEADYGQDIPACKQRGHRHKKTAEPEAEV